MDVTSLLNVSSAGLKRRDSVASSAPSATGDTTAPSTAVPTPSPERATPPRRIGGTGSPARNRKPWDAGGYSLPLTIDTKSIPSPSQRRGTYCSESPSDDHISVSPNSPIHKYSTSRSSLSSSYTSSSSTNSGSHSRISSLSTVSEFQPLTTLITDISLESNKNTENNDTMPAKKKSIDSEATTSTGPRRPAAPRCPDDQQVATMGRPVTINLDGDEDLNSPTDAVLIRRGQNGPNAVSQTESPVDLTTSGEHSPSSSHRRATSAPDLSPHGDTSQSSALVPVSSGQASALTTVSAPGGAYHSRLYLDPILVDASVPRLYPTVDELMKEIDFTLPRVCKFMDVCTLTAPGEEANWRKAMSHIFGRNKNCTRSIPDQVWICLCRKHYQRARYRNHIEYNKRLCNLVETQILRLEAWSNENRRSGHPENGIVVDWRIEVRKRERNRENQSSKKRPREDDDNAEGNDGPEEDDMPVINVNTNTQPVPEWLRAKCRPGYTTHEVQQIVAQIGREMQGKNPRLTQVPDIEILPNITGENAKPQGKSKAKKATASHRRAQSLGTAMVGPSREGLAQPTTLPPDNQYTRGGDGRSLNKRARLGEGEDPYAGHGPGVAFPPRVTDYTVPNVRPLRDVNGQFRDERTSSSMPYNYGPQTGPLPAPRPSYSYDPPGRTFDDYHGRATHQRAFSDVGGFNWSAIYPESSAPTGYNGMSNGPGGFTPYPAPATNSYNGPSYNGNRDYMARPGGAYPAAAAPGPSQNGFGNYYDSFAPRQPQQQPAAYGQQQQQPYYGGMPPSSAAKHMRHQSTPVGPPRPMHVMGSGADMFGGAGAGGYGQNAMYGGGQPSRQPYGDNNNAMPRFPHESESGPAPGDMTGEGYQAYSARR